VLAIASPLLFSTIWSAALLEQVGDEAALVDFKMIVQKTWVCIFELLSGMIGCGFCKISLDFSIDLPVPPLFPWPWSSRNVA